MEYGMNYILVKSNWFDPQASKTKIIEIGIEGFLLYLMLFKFKLHNFDKNSNSIVTSINLLSKELPKKYTKELIYDTIRLLHRKKIIKVTNVTNWNTQMSINGNLDFDRILVINPIDYPQTKAINENGKWIDKPVCEDDYYIAVHCPTIDYYLNKLKLDEKYIALFVLMQKYHRTTNGFYMSMEKMEHVTGIDKNTINRMTWKLYELKLLCAYRKENHKGDYYHEYYICKNTDESSRKQFIATYGDDIDKWIKRLDKRKEQQKKKNEKKSTVKVKNNHKQSKDIIESQINTNTVEDEKPLAFGTKKAQVNSEVWGDPEELDKFCEKYLG